MTDPDARAAFVRALGDIPVISDPELVRQRSRDLSRHSPVCKPQSDALLPDMVVCARSRNDVVRILAAAHRYWITVGSRDDLTGDTGEASPGCAVMLDLTRLDRIVWMRDGVVRVEAGARMIDIDRVLRERGWELRVFPSTKCRATVGCFVRSGSEGIGSVAWGGMRDSGNLIGLELVTAEAAPRVLQLRGRHADLAQHGPGAGFVTELELPLAPAMAWRDVAVAFAGFMQGARFCLAVANAPGIDCKLVSTVDAPIVASFGNLRERVSPGESLALLMVAQSSLLAVSELAEAHDGRIVRETDTLGAETGADTVPLYEYSWNHTALRMLRQDPSVTYLRTLFPAADPLAHVERVRERFGNELPMHLEFLRAGGAVTCVGLPIIRFTTSKRLFDIIRGHEDSGVRVADPRRSTIEGCDGSRQVPDLHPGSGRASGLSGPEKMRHYLHGQLHGIAE